MMGSYFDGILGGDRHIVDLGSVTLGTIPFP